MDLIQIDLNREIEIILCYERYIKQSYIDSAEVISDSAELNNQTYTVYATCCELEVLRDAIDLDLDLRQEHYTDIQDLAMLTSYSSTYTFSDVSTRDLPTEPKEALRACKSGCSEIEPPRIWCSSGKNRLSTSSKDRFDVSGYAK